MSHEEYMREALKLAGECVTNEPPPKPGEAVQAEREGATGRTGFSQRGKRISAVRPGGDDVPVGCVVVSPDGKIIGRGRNRREANRCATAHAEVEAINEACAAVGSWRLEGCTLYVTLEPCPMCAGAIINARVDTVRYGAREGKSGCCGSVLNLFEERFNHRPRIYGGLLEGECRGLLEDFFQNLREI